MILSFSRKFIFIKTRKCGGTSIQNALLPYCRNNDIVSLGYTNLVNKQHSRLSEFANFYEIKDKFIIDLDEYYKFGIIRNPYSIPLSRFLFQIRMKRINSNIDIESFNKWCKESYFVENGRYFKDKWSLYLYHKDEKVVDKIYKLENIQEEISHLESKLGISLNIKKDNQSNFNNYRYKEWNNSETIDLIKKYFNEEIIYGQY